MVGPDLQLGMDGVVRHRLRRRLASGRADTDGVSAPVGTVLLVIITVAMAAVVGAFLMGLVQVDEPAPTVEVVTTRTTERFNAHVDHVSEERPLREFKLIAKSDNGSFIIYDGDGDAVGETPLIVDLDTVAVGGGTGPQMTPIIYVDADANGRVSSGDFLSFFSPFYAPLAPLIDVTHGYKIVGKAPSGVHRNSKMLVVASTTTLISGEVHPGDLVKLTIAKGGDVYYETEGTAAVSGIWTTSVDIPMAWPPATYSETQFTIRPGEPDELTVPYPIKILPENPVSKAQQAYWDLLNNPLKAGSQLVLVHKPTNTVVLEIAL